MKILHITNWYPSRPSPLSATWIRNHIKSLPDYVINTIYHIEIKRGSLKILTGKNDDNSSYFIFHFPLEIWKLYEVISLILVLIVLVINRKRELEAINFHIAYPNCTYIYIIKKLINKPIIITEHWSAYYYDFNIIVPRKRKRIQKIFHHNIPVITVSNSLMEDIRRFSNSNFPGYVIPNVVHTDVFTYCENPHNKDKYIFLAVSQWKWPKDPFILLKAWKTIQNGNKNKHLIIGGYGPQWNDMVALVNKLGISDTVELRGKMNQIQIAEEMNRATAFIHISQYETFSVVCAEALCCGTPVIASNVGGIKELINSQNGILSENNENDIVRAIRDIIKNKKHYNRREISLSAINIYNNGIIGKKYSDTIKDILQKK